MVAITHPNLFQRINYTIIENPRTRYTEEDNEVYKRRYEEEILDFVIKNGFFKYK